MLRLKARKECEELKAEVKRQTVDIEFESLEKLRIEEELETVKAAEKKKVIDETEEALSELRRKNEQLEIKKMDLEREYEALGSQIMGLENDIMRLVGEKLTGWCPVDRSDGSVVNVMKVFDCLVAAHANGGLEISERQKVENARRSLKG